MARRTRTRTLQKLEVYRFSPDDISIDDGYATMRVPLNLDPVLDTVHSKVQSSYKKQADGPVSVTVLAYSLYSDLTPEYESDIAVFADVKVQVEFELKESYAQAEERRNRKMEEKKKTKIEKLKAELARLEGC